MSGNVERRKHKRAKKALGLSYRIKSDETHKTVSTIWHLASTVDLSAGGVLIHHVKDLAIGTYLDLKINISPSTPPIVCAGRIVRIDKQTNPPECNTAIVFTEIGLKEKAMLDKIVEESLM